MPTTNKKLQDRIAELETQLREARSMPPTIVEVETQADDEFYNDIARAASTMVAAQEQLAAAVEKHHERTSMRRHPASQPPPDAAEVESKIVVRPNLTIVPEDEGE